MRTNIFLLVTLIVLGLTTANAQKQTGEKSRLTPVELANKQTERMATELKLNDKQKTEVAAINIKYTNLRNEIYNANKGNKVVIQSKMKDLNAQKKVDLKKALTADQFSQLEQMEQKREEVKNQKNVKTKGAGSTQPVK